MSPWRTCIAPALVAGALGCTGILGVTDVDFTTGGGDGGGASHPETGTGGDAGAGGPIALAQPAASAPVVFGAADAGASASLTLSNPVTEGDTLVVGAYWTYGILEASPPTMTATDSLGNTWRAATMVYDNYGQGGGTHCKADAQIVYVQASKGGADTVTLTTSQPGNTDFGFTVLDYSGSSVGVDAFGGQVAPSASSTASSGALVTTGPKDVLVGVFIDTAGSGLMTPGAGFSVRGSASSLYAIVEDDAPTGAPPGNHTVTATLPDGQSDACWTVAAAAFR